MQQPLSGDMRTSKTAPHKFQIGEIGPEGGGVPLSIDGKDVDWEVHMYRDTNGEAIVEWLAEGKIYTQENITLERQSDGP